ncbi:hypothetical protein PS6_002914 [Mucor atramentarius]
MLRIYKVTQVRNERLPKIESMIGNLQQELPDIQALRAGIKWREQGETSAGFLNRLASHRCQQRAISTLIHPTTSTTCESTVYKQAAAVDFYEKLYTADAVNHDAIRYFTNQIPDAEKILDSAHDALCAPFTIKDLAADYSRAPKQFSLANVAFQVYSDALLMGVFPAS